MHLLELMSPTIYSLPCVQLWWAFCDVFSVMVSIFCKEASLMRGSIRIRLECSKEFMLVWQSDDSGFFSRMTTLAQKLAKFPIPGLIFLLLNGPYIQLNSCLFTLMHACHLLHLYAYIAMLEIVLVHRCCNWVGMFNCHSPVAACIAFSGTHSLF